MKIKCHLHSVEANVRSIELALADAIRKANPEHRKLFRSGDAAQHALAFLQEHTAEPPGDYEQKVAFLESLLSDAPSGRHDTAGGRFFRMSRPDKPSLPSVEGASESDPALQFVRASTLHETVNTAKTRSFVRRLFG